MEVEDAGEVQAEPPFPVIGQSPDPLVGGVLERGAFGHDEPPDLLEERLGLGRI
jgi:hypothetical protein